jgi:hypothetical protein
MVNGWYKYYIGVVCSGGENCKVQLTCISLEQVKASEKCMIREK